MKRSENLYAAEETGTASPPDAAAGGDCRSREQTLNRIKCALVTTTHVTLETHQNNRVRGFDPYDSRMGQPAGNIWDRGRHRR